MLIPSLLLLRVAAIGCNGATVPVEPDLQAPSFSISDAAHDSNPGFYSFRRW